MPVAIELAAGWSQDDSVAEIARRIAQSAAFLTTDLRNVPDRQRSLQAVYTDYRGGAVGALAQAQQC